MEKIQAVVIEGSSQVASSLCSDQTLLEYFDIHIYPLEKLNGNGVLKNFLDFIRKHEIEVALLDANIINNNGLYYEYQANDLADYLKKNAPEVEAWNISDEEPVQPFAKLYKKQVLKKNIHTFLAALRKELTLFAMYRHRDWFGLSSSHTPLKV